VEKNKKLLLIAGSVLLTGTMLRTTAVAGPQTYKGCYIGNLCFEGFYGQCTWTPQPNNCACYQLGGYWTKTWDCSAIGPPIQN